MTPEDTDPIGNRIRTASESVSAPLALRESLVRKPGPRPYPSRWTLATVGFTLAIIATMASLLAPGGPTVATVARAVLQSPERAASKHAGYFDGFAAVGARTDTVKGRKAVTVIYRRGASGVHYAIVDGKPLDLPGTRRIKAGSLELAPGREGNATFVAWHQDGKTCVLVSDTLDTDALVALLTPA